MRVRRTDTGVEFDFDADAFAHGAASRRIGLAKADNPFVLHGSNWESWLTGWESVDNLIRMKEEAA